MISRQQIRQFLAIVDTGSFSQAADRVGVTQPTLSAGIAEIERQVGAKLFVRDRRAIRLTSAGNRMLGPARIIDREFRQVEGAGAAPTAAARVFRLGLLHSLPTRLIEVLVASIADIEVLTIFEGTASELCSRLAARRLDAAVTLLEKDEQGETVLNMYEEGYRMMMPANHRFAGHHMIDAHEMAEETMIARRSCEILAETSRFFTQRGVRPHFGLRAANDDRCLAMVRAGLGITTAPQSLVQDGIVAVRVAGYDYKRRVGLVFGSVADMESETSRRLVEACAETALLFAPGSR